MARGLALLVFYIVLWTAISGKYASYLPLSRSASDSKMSLFNISLNLRDLCTRQDNVKYGLRERKIMAILSMNMGILDIPVCSYFTNNGHDVINNFFLSRRHNIKRNYKWLIHDILNSL